MPPLPGKVIKLSFSTSPKTPKTLSPRFSSALVSREAEILASRSRCEQVMVGPFLGAKMATASENSECHRTGNLSAGSRG